MDYWLDGMPDMTDMPTISSEKLGLWNKIKKSDRGKPFGPAPGLKGAWMLQALDFAASHNCWAVVLVDDDGAIVRDLVPAFILTVWVKYVSLMHGKPMPSVNSAQLVLKYMLIERKRLTAAYRNRLYRFSSGSVFKDCTADLDDHLEEHGLACLREVQ